ncbi:hypothetical protein BX616_007906, partial [Lobosporangium transversale]
KEVKERGWEGAKDMGEGFAKIGEEMSYIAKDKVKDTVDSAKDSAKSLKDSGEKMLTSAKEGVQEHLPQISSSSSISDAGSQDLARTGRFMFYNFSVAPVIHTWYSFLDKKFPLADGQAGKVMSTQGSRVARTMAPAFKRMVADQALFAPVGLVLMFSGLTVLEGGGVQGIKHKLDNTFVDTLKTNYMVWPLVQLVNFSMMPLQLRLPFVSAVGIAWNAYLSLVNNRAQQSEKRQLALEEQRPSKTAMSS